MSVQSEIIAALSVMLTQVADAPETDQDLVLGLHYSAGFLASASYDILNVDKDIDAATKLKECGLYELARGAMPMIDTRPPLVCSRCGLVTPLSNMPTGVAFKFKCPQCGQVEWIDPK